MVLYVSIKFHENISKGFKVIEPTQFPRGIIQQNVSGVMVLVLCTSSDDALYLYKVS